LVGLGLDVCFLQQLGRVLNLIVVIEGDNRHFLFLSELMD